MLFEQLEKRSLFSAGVGGGVGEPLAASQAVAAAEQAPHAMSVTLTATASSFRADRTLELIVTLKDLFSAETALAGQHVSLETEAGVRLATVQVGADGVGTFILGGLSAGEYRLRAVFSGWTGYMQAPLAAATSGLATVTATPGEVSEKTYASVALRGQAAARYPAEIVLHFGEAGKPVPTGRVALYGWHRSRSSFLGWAEIDDFGRASVVYEPGDQASSQRLAYVYEGDANYASSSWTGVLTVASGGDRYVDTRMHLYYGTLPDGQARFTAKLVKWDAWQTHAYGGVVHFMMGDALLGVAVVDRDGVARLELDHAPARPTEVVAHFGGYGLMQPRVSTAVRGEREVIIDTKWLDISCSTTRISISGKQQVAALGELAHGLDAYADGRFIGTVAVDPRDGSVNGTLAAELTPGPHAIEIRYRGDALHDAASVFKEANAYVPDPVITRQADGSLLFTFWEGEGSLPTASLTVSQAGYSVTVPIVDGRAVVPAPRFQPTLSYSISGDSRYYLPGVTSNVTAPLVGDAPPISADVNGDGRTDEVFYDKAQRQLWIGIDRDEASPSYSRLNPVAEGWRLAGVSDFDGDGSADLLWTHDALRKQSIWRLRGAAILGFSMLNHAPRVSTWVLDEIKDLDNDGDADLVWRNLTTGGKFGWLMDGTKVVGGMRVG
jgi:hypothetical protein